jgi:hypothetical protein
MQYKIIRNNILRAKISGMSDISYIHEEIKEQIKYGEC